MHHVMHGTMPTNMGIPSTHKTAPAGRTHGVLAEGIAEGYAIFLHQSIKIGSHSRFIAQMSQSVSTKLIRVED